jgi:pyruvate/2-oxoglutarate dehydrogenase complex dihydrolipoamide acyltransferase (E2) component
MLVVAATAANAQAPRYQTTSDFEGPYVGGPPPAPAPGYYGAPPAYGPPPAAYAPPPGYGAPLLPIQEVYAVLRDNGFSPLGAPFQRGLTYVIAVIDRGGEDGRLVIDARNGRIIRFTPAFRSNGYYGDRNGYYGERSGYYGDRYAPPPPYGPPGVLPPMAPISGDARPQVSAPHMASRAVPLPQPKPAVAGKQPEVTPQKSASVETKPAAPTPKPAAAPASAVQAAATAISAAAAQTAVPLTPASGATVLAPEAKPQPSIAPTQPMPKVQGLE